MNKNLRYTYHIKDEFFNFLRKNNADNYLMSNKECGKYRPTYLCFNDPKEDKIFWFVPLSSQYDKFAKIKEDKEKKYGNCLGIVLGQYDGKNSVFLIQNAFPALEKYIDHVHTRNNNPIPVDYATAKEVEKKLKRALFLKENKNIKIGFADTDKIYRLMKEQLKQ